MVEQPVAKPVTMECVTGDPNDPTLLCCRILNGQVPSGNVPFSGSHLQPSVSERSGKVMIKPAPEPSICADYSEEETITARRVFLDGREFLEVLGHGTSSMMEEKPPQKIKSGLKKMKTRLSKLKGCGIQSCALPKKSPESGDNVEKQTDEEGEGR